MRFVRWIAVVAALAGNDLSATELAMVRPEGSIRVATFNASLVRKGAGVLIHDIDKRDAQVLAVAEIILRTRPDILLVNEIDHDPEGLAVERFIALLREGVGGLAGLDYPHHFADPPNTGVPSGFDLDGDGKTMGPRDALGFGRFPGQFGMAVLSRFDFAQQRTFRNIRWAQIPWSEAPRNPDGTPYYTEAAWTYLPMSSKSHWDISVILPDGRTMHLLASHPTPPVFDGPENRNGLRNAAEIRFWLDYIEGADWIIDDAGVQGALTGDAPFVVFGDLNADPVKGDGDRATIRELIDHRLVRDPRPASAGAAAASARESSEFDTADWPETDGPGNLRVDYVLPSTHFDILAAGVFWPAPDDPLEHLVRVDGGNRTSSDHRLVWVDIRMEN